MRKTFMAAALLVGTPLMARTIPISRAKTYGTTRPTTASVYASEFIPGSSSVGWATYESATGGVSRYQTAPGGGRWWAPLRVPDGALIQGISLEGCDSTTTGQLHYGLRRTRFDDGADIEPVGGTGTDAAYGCAFATVFFDDPPTIDNSNYDYWVFVQWEGDFSEALRVQTVQVSYYLQVSPAPTTYVTFNDVPASHPFFQFVEALAYSGITAGCGSDNYCPDAPLTRGQMAVFLAKALGLAWP